MNMGIAEQQTAVFPVLNSMNEHGGVPMRAKLEILKTRVPNRLRQGLKSTKGYYKTRDFNKRQEC